VEALIAAIQRVEAREFDFSAATLQAHAATFDKAIFKEKIQAFIDNALAEPLFVPPSKTLPAPTEA
jgi:hypothetical protein